MASVGNGTKGAFSPGELCRTKPQCSLPIYMWWDFQLLKHYIVLTIITLYSEISCVALYLINKLWGLKLMSGVFWALVGVSIQGSQSSFPVLAFQPR